MKILCFLLTLCALAACSAPLGGVPKPGRYIVTAMSTPFYKYGPAQGNADFMLAKGRALTLVKHTLGFSQVTTAEGQGGYVANEDIAPAPEPKPTPTPAPVKPRRAKRSIYEQLPQPTFDETPGLPMPDTPTPSFRY